MNKTVLVLGVTGLVGNAIKEELSKQDYEVYGTFNTYRCPEIENFTSICCDVCSMAELSGVVEYVDPAVVINATAFANVDKCETDREVCWNVNVKGIQNLLESFNGYIVHFSTDYVFDGTKDEYTETDVPNPLNFYGVSKLCGEMLLLGQQNSLIVRTTGVYGWELQKKNFVYRVLNTVGKGQELKVPIDQIGCPTYAPNLAEVVRRLVDKEVVGILNVNGATRLNRYEFAKLVCDIFGLDKTLLHPIETKELGQLAKRPLKGGLSIEEVKNILPETNILTAQKGLEAMKADLARRAE